MKRRGILMLALAFAFAGVAVFLARDWLESQITSTAAGEQAIPLTTVVVARTGLNFGNSVRSEHLRVVDWPSSSVPPQSFKTIEEVLGDGEEPRVVLRRIELNEPVLGSKISGFGERASLSAKIDTTLRAVTIRVNDVLGVAGFVLPGDRVDVLLTRKNARKELINGILLENVKVLGVDQDANNRKDQPTVAKAVTLEVTSKQAQKLTLAAQVGTLTLALRNLANTAGTKSRIITVADLYITESNKPKPVKATKSGTKVTKKKTKATKATKAGKASKMSTRTTKRSAKVDDMTTVTIIRGMQPSTEQVLKEAAATIFPRRSPGEPIDLLEMFRGSATGSEAQPYTVPDRPAVPLMDQVGDGSGSHAVKLLPEFRPGV